MMIARKIIYNIFYRHEQFNEDDILKACVEHINLIRIFRRENKLYLNQNMDFRQLRVLDYMCDILKKVIDISPKLSTIIRKYKRDDNHLNCIERNLNHNKIVRYKFFLNSRINEPSNEFLLRKNIKYFERDEMHENIDSETKLDLDNDRRRHGINNQEKIELLYVADMKSHI